jgi:hypothetical protein
MYQLEEISRPQLYPRACICLMMYFKNNWNAGPFLLLHGFLKMKKTVCKTILVYANRVEMTLLILKHYIFKQYLIFA